VAGAAAIGDDRVADLTAAAAAVEVIRPGRLDRERAGRQGDVLRGALPRGDPGALVAVLVARGVGPAAGWELVGDRLGVLVALDDRDAVERARRADVDEVLAAGAPHVGHVRHVRERDR